MIDYESLDCRPTYQTVFFAQVAVNETIRKDMVRIIIALAGMNYPHCLDRKLTWVAIRSLDIFLSIYRVNSSDIVVVAVTALFYATKLLQLKQLSNLDDLAIDCSNQDFLTLFNNFNTIVTKRRLGPCPIDSVTKFCQKFHIPANFESQGLLLMEVSLLYPKVCLQRHDILAAAVCGIVSKFDDLRGLVNVRDFYRHFRVNSGDLLASCVDLVTAYGFWRNETKRRPLDCPVFAKFASSKYHNASTRLMVRHKPH